MHKIDGHLHLVRSIAGFNRNGRLNPLGDGRAVWDTGEAIRLFPKGYGDEAFLVEDALRLMDTGDVHKAVLLQGSLNGYQNAYTAEVVKRFPEQFVGAFAIDPFTEHARQIVQYHVETLGFRIMKLEMSAGGGLHGYHAPFNVATLPILQEIWTYLSQIAGATVVIDYGDDTEVSHQPAAIVALAKRYPMLTFVVAHLSFPHVARLNQLQDTLAQFSTCPNIYLDLSAIQDIDQDTQFPFPKSQMVVREAIQYVGADHLMWGSDAPLSATFNPYVELATWLERSGAFTNAELQAIYYQTAETVYFKPAE